MSVTIETRLNDAHVALSEGKFSAAAQIYGDLAKEGIVEAQGSLGWLLEEGKGLPKDEDAAVLWYERASSAGDEWSRVRLGGIFERRMLLEKAKQCYVVAADRGGLRAAYRLGMMHRRYGSSVMDFEEAIKWLKLAEQRGHVWSDVMISHLMLTGTVPGGKLRVIRRALSVVFRVIQLALRSGRTFERDERLLR